MLKIWGRQNSTNVRKVLWCAEEAGVPYARVDAGGAFGIVDDPAYRALNPNGLVPTIEDDGLVLWESNAIVRYLAARYAPGRLWPEDPAERAIGDRWMDWTTARLSGPMTPVIRGMLRTRPAERDVATITAAVAECGRALAVADAALARAPYLSGPSFGIGDIPLGCLAYAWFGMAIERPALPHLEAWYDRLTERPAFRAGVMTPLT